MKREIKTKSEFELQFGLGWQSTVECSWNSDMNYLFGKLLENIDCREYLSPREKFRASVYEQGYNGHRVARWTLSEDMVKELN
jgi:hypothetical protein